LELHFSIIGNEIRNAELFIWRTLIRLLKAWNKWMVGIGPTFEYLFLGGFLISVLFYRKVSNQKLPLQIFLALAVAVLLVLQRVSPLPRIWIYLEAFYLMFAAAGAIWLVHLLFANGSTLTEDAFLGDSTGFHRCFYEYADCPRAEPRLLGP
jgi:hypothetical protein